MIEEGASVLTDKQGVEKCSHCGEYKGWFAESEILCFDCRVKIKQTDALVKSGYFTILTIREANKMFGHRKDEMFVSEAMGLNV